MNIGLGARRRTILIVDADAHARAGLRVALERAGFSVGEAASGPDGERTLLRIEPDALLYDIMMDHAGHAGALSERMKAIGSTIPCYGVSTAAEALVGSVGLHELGLAGVFLKPVDVALVIETLKTRLAAPPDARKAGHA